MAKKQPEPSPEPAEAVLEYVNRALDQVDALVATVRRWQGAPTAPDALAAPLLDIRTSLTMARAELAPELGE
ncbi:MAG: hypothetical protein ACRELA_16190 [Candidatus Rokuibacteriota bacterium]